MHSVTSAISGACSSVQKLLKSPTVVTASVSSAMQVAQQCLPKEELGEMLKNVGGNQAFESVHTASTLLFLYFAARQQDPACANRGAIAGAFGIAAYEVHRQVDFHSMGNTALNAITSMSPEMQYLVGTTTVLGGIGVVAYMNGIPSPKEIYRSVSNSFVSKKEKEKKEDSDEEEKLEIKENKKDLAAPLQLDDKEKEKAKTLVVSSSNDMN